MYLPSHFEETRAEVLHAFIGAHPLATVVTYGAHGLLANPVPLLLRAHPGEPTSLLGHVARQNPMWQEAASTGEAIALFQGPSAYISPSWYPSKHEHGRAVPTWNYVTVHAHGTLRIHDEVEWVRRQVEALTEQHESSHRPPWTLSDAPPEYRERMLQSIVGIELVITRLVGKWKVSQNQSEVNRAGVVQGLLATGRPQDASMAALVAAVGTSPSARDPR